ncbi:hypothetical protein [Neisseria sp. CCUG12390]|uniref:hypothetical protein n=1 Tax=Neisseria sp. CCUG12390 TaxID=3392035 RepID=UPI003A10316B
MLKYLVFLPLGLALWQPVNAAVIEPYQAKGCRYEGEVDKANKPHGKGEWACQDGRSYQGQFKNGRFDGKGIYTVNTVKPVFLEPFTVNSTRLNKMVLTGQFKQGLAEGKFQVTQNNEPLFVITFDKGMMKDVKLATQPKKK